jgi:hypothetical protein
MTYGEAIRYIDTHPATAGFQREILGSRLIVFSGPDYTITLNDNEIGLVVYVYVTSQRRLSDLIIALGPPHLIRVVYAPYRSRNTTAPRGTLWLMYHTRQIVVDVPLYDDRLAPDLTFGPLRMTAAGFNLSRPDLTWRGFARLQKYQ